MSTECAGVPIAAISFWIINSSRSASPSACARRSSIAPASTSITHVGADDLETWVQVSADGFLHADNEGVAHHETFSREILERALRSSISQHYLAWRDGEPAAAASMRIVDGVAWLNGSATLPAHRRRGLQTALVQHRLALARDEGADIATMTTSPGSRSKHNAERRGFALAYSRAVLRRPHRASRA